MKPNEAADHEWIRQRKARQKNSTKDKKGYFFPKISSTKIHSTLVTWTHTKFFLHKIFFIQKTKGQNLLERATQNLMFNKRSKYFLKINHS